MQNLLSFHFNSFRCKASLCLSFRCRRSKQNVLLGLTLQQGHSSTPMLSQAQLFITFAQSDVIETFSINSSSKPNLFFQAVGLPSILFKRSPPNPSKNETLRHNLLRHFGVRRPSFPDKVFLFLNCGPSLGSFIHLIDHQVDLPHVQNELSSLL